MRIADFDELANIAGQRTGNFAKDMATKAGDFVCGLYKDYPGAVIPNLANTFVRGMWDGLCAYRTPGLPEPPKAPFKGGQCVCAPYYIEVRFTSRLDPTYVGRVAGSFLGPIEGVKHYYSRFSGGNVLVVLCRGYASQPCSATTVERSIYSSGSGTTEDTYNPTIDVLVRTDGQADSCGDLAPFYPKVSIPADRSRGTASHTYNDGSEVSVPLVYVDSLIKNNITVNVGGVNFEFDYEGVGVTDDALRAIEDRIKGIEDGVKDIQDNLPQAPKPPSSGDYDEAETTEETSEDKDGVEGLQWVQIELIRSPSNAKKQYGRGAQDVVYAGWFQFVVDGFYLPRDPIHFGKCVYNAPDGATGYAFTLYEGYSAAVKEFKRKSKEEGS